jgi:hypothetical protein
MRLACAEIHHVGALGAQLGGLGGHSHGCGNLNPANAVCENLGRSGVCHDSSILTDLRAEENRLRKNSEFRLVGNAGNCGLDA